MQRDSFVFYRSFFEAMQEIGEGNSGRLLNMLCNYALDGIEPSDDADAMLRALFMLLKPQIDKNNARYENGRRGGSYGARGGRPQNPKETPSKPQNNPNLTPNVNVNDNVNVNVNDNGVGDKLPPYVHTHVSEGESEQVERYYTEFKEEILNDTTTSMELQRLYGKTKGELLKYLDTFQKLQRVNVETYANRTLYRSHFNKWMHIQVLNGQSHDQSQPRNGHTTETDKIIGNANTFTTDTAGTGDIE